MAGRLTGEALKLLAVAEAHKISGELRLFYVPDSRITVGRGFPDLVVAGPGGLVFAECKGYRERLSDDQWAWRHLLLKAGCIHRIWTPAQLESGEIESALRGLAEPYA